MAARVLSWPEQGVNTHCGVEVVVLVPQTGESGIPPEGPVQMPASSPLFLVQQVWGGPKNLHFH